MKPIKLKKIKTIEEIYYKIKEKAILICPIGMFYYIRFDDKKYDWTSYILDFHDKNDEENIKKMYEISKKEDFYAFLNSKKGMEFYEKNKKAIHQELAVFIAHNAGFSKPEIEKLLNIE